MEINKSFIARLGYNLHAFNRLTHDISHNQSMILPDFEVNNINWIVGHIIESRNELLEILGKAPVWNDFTRVKYQTGSRVISSLSNPGESFEDLVRVFKSTHDLLTQIFMTMDKDEFSREISMAEGPSSIADTVNGYLWHETYHIGQLELLRPLIGKTDKVF